MRFRTLNLSLFERLIRRPLHRVKSSVHQFLDHSIRACCARLSAIHRQPSSISLSTTTKFLQSQREELHFPGHTYLWFLYLPVRLVLWSPVIVARAISEAIFDIATTTTIMPRATHIPTFYAPRTISGVDSDSFLFLFALPIVAIIFGAFHCIAWNFQFPSHTEQLLWHIGALIITLIPSVPLIVNLALYLFVGLPSLLLEMLEIRHGGRASILLSERYQKILDAMIFVLGFIVFFLACVGLIGYILARISILT